MNDLFLHVCRWTHIAVDSIRAKHSQHYHILFVTTLEGTLRKMVQLPGTSQMCTIEIVQIIPEGIQEPVKSLKLLPDQGVLFLSTNSRILRIPVQRCYRYLTKEACIASQVKTLALSLVKIYDFSQHQNKSEISFSHF